MEFVTIPSGQYYIGSKRSEGYAYDAESSEILVELLMPFDIANTPVTNEEFKCFVKETGYVTEAEQLGWAWVCDYFLSEEVIAQSKSAPTVPWWRAVEGASWYQPEGHGSNIEERLFHPVVQVSRNDALAYCVWSGLRLSTEIQWEIAAKGGKTYERYPWGEQLTESNQHWCNVWQGIFPIENTLEDGYANTAPVKTYAPNGYGCYQMIGNVWEWCCHEANRSLQTLAIESSHTLWYESQRQDDRLYSLRGGSFLCHESYCNRHRITGRNQLSGRTASHHVGFRCVRV